MSDSYKCQLNSKMVEACNIKEYHFANTFFYYKKYFLWIEKNNNTQIATLCCKCFMLPALLCIDMRCIIYTLIYQGRTRIFQAKPLEFKVSFIYISTNCLFNTIYFRPIETWTKTHVSKLRATISSTRRVIYCSMLKTWKVRWHYFSLSQHPW